MNEENTTRERALALYNQANLILKSCNFDRSDVSQSEVYGRGHELLLAAAKEDSTWDQPLLRLCAISTRFNKGTSFEVIGYAEEALQRRESYDAVAYLCKAYLGSLDSPDAYTSLALLRASLSNPDLAALCGVFLGIEKYNAGNIIGYCQAVDQFNKGKSQDFNPYMAIPISTVRTGPSLASKTLSIGDIAPSQLVSFKAIPEQILSVSCDIVYFDRYKDLFFKGLLASQTPGTGCHLAMVADSESSALERVETLRDLDANIAVSLWIVGETENKGPIAASVRMMHMAQLLDHNVPVISLDFDSALVTPIEGMLDSYPGHDLLLRELTNVAPWERITGGFTAVFPTAAGKLFADHLCGFLSSRLSLHRSQWWVDQNALESAWRALIEAQVEFKSANVFAVRDKYLIQPTGTDSLKLQTLERALER